MCEQWNHIFRDKMTTVLQKGRAGPGPGLRPPAALGTHASCVLWNSTQSFHFRQLESHKEQKALAVKTLTYDSLWSISLDSREENLPPQRDHNWVLSQSDVLYLLFTRACSNQRVASREGSWERVLSQSGCLGCKWQKAQLKVDSFQRMMNLQQGGDFCFRYGWIQELRGCHRVALSPSFIHPGWLPAPPAQCCNFSAEAGRGEHFCSHWSS